MTQKVLSAPFSRRRCGAELESPSGNHLLIVRTRTPSYVTASFFCGDTVRKDRALSRATSLKCKKSVLGAFVACCRCHIVIECVGVPRSDIYPPAVGGYTICAPTRRPSRAMQKCLLLQGKHPYLSPQSPFSDFSTSNEIGPLVGSNFLLNSILKQTLLSRCPLVT